MALDAEEKAEGGVAFQPRSGERIKPRAQAPGGQNSKTNQPQKARKKRYDTGSAGKARLLNRCQTQEVPGSHRAEGKQKTSGQDTIASAQTDEHIQLVMVPRNKTMRRA